MKSEYLSRMKAVKSDVKREDIKSLNTRSIKVNQNSNQLEGCEKRRRIREPKTYLKTNN